LDNSLGDDSFRSDELSDRQGDDPCYDIHTKQPMTPNQIALIRCRHINFEKKKVVFDESCEDSNESVTKEEVPELHKSLERNIEFSQDILNHRKLFNYSNNKLNKKYKFFYDPYVTDKTSQMGKSF